MILASSGTDFVVDSESRGSKLDDANKHVAKAIDEKEFLKLAGKP